MYVSLDAELEGVDSFPAHEIGDHLDNSQDCKVVSVGDYRKEQTNHLAAKVDDSDQADYLYLATVELEGDVILNDLFDAVEETDMEVLFDYDIEQYVIAREQ